MMSLRLLPVLWLMLLPQLAHAFYQGQYDDTSLELRGFFRSIALALDHPKDPLLFSDDRLLTGGAIGRLMLDVHGPAWSVELHAMQSVIDHDLRTGGSRLTKLSDVERSDAFHWRYADQHADLVIDRLNLQYSSDTINIKLGRQAINFASTFYFSPNDFFAPFAAQIFFRAYKPGVDALRLDWQWDDLSQLSLIGVIDYSTDLRSNTGWSKQAEWGNTSYLARASTLIADFEWAIIVATIDDADIVGIDFQGELFDWLGVRAEGHMRFPDQTGQARDTKVALGLEHRFENTLTLRFEQFYQRSGATQVTDYGANTSTTFYLARNYTAVGANYEISPLLIGDATWLYNHHDQSRLLALYSTYSLSNESELSLGITIASGKRPENGSIKSEFGTAPDSINIEYRLYF